MEYLARTIEDEQGKVDFLFNVAGLNITNSHTGFRAFPDNNKIMDVNFHGTLQMCKTFLPIMKPGGRIVNLSSVASSLRPFSQDLQARFRNSSMTIGDLQALAVEYEIRPVSVHPVHKMDPYSGVSKSGHRSIRRLPHSGYSVSKACINAMTTIIAREHPGILINACCPGWVATDMGKQVGTQPPKSASRSLNFHHLQSIDSCCGSQWSKNSAALRFRGNRQYQWQILGQRLG